MKRTNVNRAFTIIELLVVISIIAVLASLLMPALVTVRRATETLKCANNQRQLTVGFLAYAADHGELPTCYRPAWTHAWNWADEGAGFIDMPRGPVIGIPSDTVNTPFSQAWEGGYVPTAIKGCQKKQPPYGSSWFPWFFSGNAYMYNGPGAAAANIVNNSNASGLYPLGGYLNRGATHGWSQLRKNPPEDRTALFVCPGVSPTAFGAFPLSTELGEPHGAPSWAPIAGQFDWPTPVYDAAYFNRNVTFADGHVKHISCTRINLKDQ